MSTTSRPVRFAGCARAAVAARATAVAVLAIVVAPAPGPARFGPAGLGARG